MPVVTVHDGALAIEGCAVTERTDAHDHYVSRRQMIKRGEGILVDVEEDISKVFEVPETIPVPRPALPSDFL